MERDLFNNLNLLTRMAGRMRGAIVASLALASSLGCEWLPGRQDLGSQGLVVTPTAISTGTLAPPIPPSLASSMHPPAAEPIGDYPPLPSGPPENNDRLADEEAPRDEEVTTAAYEPPPPLPDLDPPAPSPAPAAVLTVRIEEAFQPPAFPKAPEAPEAQPNWDERWSETVERLNQLLADRLGPQAQDKAWAARRQMAQFLRENGGDLSPEGRRELIAAIERDLPLEVIELKACRSIHGFGQYEPLPDASEIAPGDDLLLYCEMAGLRTEEADAKHRSWLESTFEVLPGTSGPAAPVCHTTLGQAEDLCRKLRRDYYVSYRVSLPSGLAPGSYRLKLIQTDLIADRTVAREIAFRIAEPASLARRVEMPPRGE